MIDKEILFKKIHEVLPYLKGNPALDSRVNLLYELVDIDLSFNLLVDNLFTSTGRNLGSFLAEINIIYDIIQSSPELKTKIKYEQESGEGTPDLKIEIDDIVIWVQLKCFSISKLEKNRSASLQLLEDKLSEEFDYFFDIKTSYELNLAEEEVQKIIESTSENGKCVYYQNRNSVNIKRNSKNYNSIIQAGFIDTSSYRSQIENSLKKAEKSMPLKNRKIINIIICQNAYHRQNNIDAGDVLFGKELICFWGKGNSKGGRKPNGIIHNENNRINYYCVYDANGSILGDCIKWMFIINDNKAVDVYNLLGIDDKHQINENDYIKGT